MSDEFDLTTHREKTPSDEENVQSLHEPSVQKFPDLPSYRCIGRSDFIRQGATHLSSSSTIPSKVLIVGEDGSGKTALILQLLHHKDVRATFGDGTGSWYIDCAPFYDDGGQSGGGPGVAFVVTILEQLNVELHPTEKDILGFLYNKLIALGLKSRILLALDNLEVENDASSQGLTMKRVLKTLASIYCVSLVVASCKPSMRQLLAWTLVLPGTDHLGPLELKDAIDMFEEISNGRLAGERDRESENCDFSRRSDISKLLEFQPANRLPLGVSLLARMQKLHRSPLEILGRLEAGRKESEATCTPEGLALIFDIILRSAIQQSQATRDVTRLMRLLAFLPEGLPDHNKVLPLLASSEYLGFNDTLDSERLVVKIGLAEKRTGTKGVEALVVSQSFKKNLRAHPDDDPSFVEDLNIFILFIDRHRRLNEDVVLALGAINIYHALTWLLKCRQDNVAANTAYGACYMLFQRRSLLNEGLMTNIRRVNEGLVVAAKEEGLAVEGGEGTKLQKARQRLVDFLLDYARLFEYLHVSDKTREIALEAEALASEMGDEIRVGESLMTQAQAGLMDARIDDLYTCNERASKIFESLGSEINLARALQGMAFAERLRDNYKDSQILGEKACELFKQHGERFYCVDAIYGLGITYKMIGKYDEALERYEEAQELSIKNGDSRLAASIRLSMGSTLVLMDRPSGATEKFQESYQLFKKLQNQVGMAKALDEIADVLCGMSRFEEAMEKSREAYTILKSFGNSPGMGNALNNWGRCLQALNKKEEAARKFREALDIFERAGLRRGRANSLFNLAKVLFLLDLEDDSLVAFKEADNIYLNLGVDSMAATCKWWQATVYAYLNLNDQAAATFKQAYEIYERLGDEDAMGKITDKLQSLSLL
ncbi:hypothetical protein CPB83DRAFT_891583 [Crepidotus variabilis]|uniref:TPR-like protein n=1 Tax=Crepidotus variabilis TaxID=179855 RepID=A0A9P6EM74_9AGAR|nr:hypothetical protein CPB83DRAFT_891583 [Crepidotus variabilis]